LLGQDAEYTFFPIDFIFMYIIAHIYNIFFFYLAIPPIFLILFIMASMANKYQL
jgi:hypothetical protein